MAKPALINGKVKTIGIKPANGCW